MALKRDYSDYHAASLIWSAVLHLLLLLAVIIGMPELWKQHRESLPTAVAVEVLPIGQTNIKPKEAQKKEKIKKKQAQTAKKARSQSSSNRPKPKPKTQAIPKPNTKKKPKPKKKEEPKKKDNKPNLDSILKSVADAAKREEGDKKQDSSEDQKKAISDQYNPSLPMAMSEIDAIRSQFVKCWNIPAGAKDAHNLRIVVDLHLQRNGQVTKVELAEDKSRYYRDSFFRAAADSAMRAVRRCSPLKNLPSQKYETWRYMQLTFDPRDLLY